MQNILRVIYSVNAIEQRTILVKSSDPTYQSTGLCFDIITLFVLWHCGQLDM